MSLPFDLLFHAAAETLHTIAADPKHLGAEIGFFAVLHTWGQQLFYHPHLHCVVRSGGLSPDGSRWVSCRRPRFFLSVRVVARLFRRLFLEYLKAAFDSGALQFFASSQPLRDRRSFLRFLNPARKAEWVVYAKPPMVGAAQVLGISRALHAPRRDLQQAPGQHRPWCRSFPLEELSLRRPGKHDDARSRRVHPPLPAPCRARRIPAHPPLRLSCQSFATAQAGSLPSATRNAAA